MFSGWCGRKSYIDRYGVDQLNVTTTICLQIHCLALFHSDSDQTHNILDMVVMYEGLILHFVQAVSLLFSSL